MDKTTLNEYAAPIEVGLYLARSGSFQWWNLVVDVHGEAPFFTVIVFNRARGTAEKGFDTKDIEAWGPRVSD